MAIGELTYPINRDTSMSRLIAMACFMGYAPSGIEISNKVIAALG